MRPLQISPETALKLAQAMNVPVERLMHMPRHLLIQKLMELSRQESSASPADTPQPPETSVDRG